MLKKNDVIQLKIDDLTNNADGIARYDNLVIFVQKALPGDVISAGITKVKKNYAYARIIEFIKKSPYRIDPPFNVHENCGGCVLQNFDYKAQLNYKQNLIKNNLIRIAGIKNPEINNIIGMSFPYFYRNKVQYPLFKDKNGIIKYGFYAPHSHRVIANDTCLIQSKEIDSLMNRLCKLLNTHKISIYNEVTNKGYLRHIVIRHSSFNGDLMLGFVINSKDKSYIIDIINEIKTYPQLKSIVINYNIENTNVILGKKSETVFGNDYIIDSIGDTLYQISLQSFFQINKIQNKSLYDVISNMFPDVKNETLVDLYCGIGSIGLYLRNKFKSIVGIEIVESAIRNANNNAVLNKADNCSFLLGDSSKIFAELIKKKSDIDNIIVDPPRKGLTEDLINDISKVKPKRIVYVSCDSATLSRDIKLFIQNNYEVSKIQPVDMFPMTTHVETVCLMTRV